MIIQLMLLQIVFPFYIIIPIGKYLLIQILYMIFVLAMLIMEKLMILLQQRQMMYYLILLVMVLI